MEKEVAKKNDPKVIKAWAFYDWANSVYNLIITTAIFPIFYETVTSGNKAMVNDVEVDVVHLFGVQFINTELYSYTFSFSFLIVVLFVPLLSGVADYAGLKKKFLQFFCYLGSLSCISLYWFDPKQLEWGMLALVMASIGFWGSLVFYNSFLPEIATPDKQDKVSARGFAMGYFGSVLLLVAILVANQLFYMNIRYAFVLVGIWWAGFAQYTYYYLPNNQRKGEQVHLKKMLSKGFDEIKTVANDLVYRPKLKWFLSSFFVYNMGVQTVMLLAVIFAKKEISWPKTADGGTDTSGLILSVILIQIIAILGAWVLARISGKIGNLKTLKIATLLWILCTVIAYFIHLPWQFYGLAVLVGFVMGGIQAISRSTYSKMLPETKDYTSYFSFYDITEKVGLIIGPLAFGLIEGVTGSMRNSVIMLSVFFILGFILLTITQRASEVKEV